MMNLIITIPAYNEEKNIGRVVTAIKDNLSKFDGKKEIIVVDDGSTDKTAHIAKKMGVTVISHPSNRGLAETFRTEMEECLKRGADIIVHTDADGQYRANEISRLVEIVEKGADLVLGSRFKGKIQYMPLIKRLGNRVFSRVIQQISGAKISDGQTGFRAFTNEVAKIPITSNFTYTQEQIIRTSKAKLRIEEVPVHFDRRGKKTKSRLMKNPLDYAVKAGVNLIRVYRDYEPLRFFGIIGGSLFITGFILGIYILITIIQTGIVGGIPRVILSTLLILTGIQIITLGFLADMWRK